MELESALITESLGFLCTSYNISDDGKPEKKPIVVSFIQPSLRGYLESDDFQLFSKNILAQNHTEFMEGGHSLF
jgi:hypothetical protein